MVGQANRRLNKWLTVLGVGDQPPFRTGSGLADYARIPLDR